MLGNDDVTAATKHIHTSRDDSNSPFLRLGNAIAGPVRYGLDSRREDYTGWQGEGLGGYEGGMDPLGGTIRG